MFLNQAMETGYSGNNNWQHYAKGEYKIEEEKEADQRDRGEGGDPAGGSVLRVTTPEDRLALHTELGQSDLD